MPPAEQIVYQRLFRLSYVRQSPFTQCRYEDLALHCGLSLRTLQRALKGLRLPCSEPGALVYVLRTLQRALKGLRQKRLLKTVWQSHGATTFHVQLLSTLPHRPAFLPRRRRELAPSPPPFQPMRPPVYDAFGPEDRELFLTCKRSLSPQRLNELTEQAVEWLTERAKGDPEAFSDGTLRDKVDELIFREVFGVDRQQRYAGVFGHLYQWEAEG